MLCVTALVINYRPMYSERIIVWNLHLIYGSLSEVWSLNLSGMPIFRSFELPYLM